eukprot:g2023.t1
MACAGAALEDISGRLASLASMAKAEDLAEAVLAVGERGFSSDTLAQATQVLSTKLNGVQLQPARLLDLAVASTKSSSLTPAVGAVARAVAANAASWPVSDLVRLLLAVAKAKKALNPEDKVQLLTNAAVALKPQLGTLPAADGVVAGLGAKHSLVERLAEFWAETVKDWTKGAGGGWDSDDEAIAPSESNEAPAGSKVLTDAIGANLIARVKELTESGRKAVEAQLETGALAEYSRKDRLKRAVAAAAASHSRSRSRRRSRTTSRDRGRPRYFTFLLNLSKTFQDENQRDSFDEVGLWHENDENIQPATPANIQDSKDRPTDDDRVRFGFKPKTPPPVTKGAVHDGSQKAAVSAGTPPPPPPPLPTGAKAFDVHTLLRRTIGDPDDVLAVLKLKPTAGKYDFKDKIADLQAMICPLKNALSDQRLKAKALVDALLSMESGINNQLQTSAQEVVMLRKAVSEEGATLRYVEIEEPYLDMYEYKITCQNMSFT